MKFFSLLLLAAVVAACSSPQPKQLAVQETASERLARAISSANDEEALETSYDQIMQDNNPAERLNDYFARLVRIYNRSDRFLREYDARLQQMYQNKSEHSSQDLLTDRTYTRMLAAWIINNRQIDKISYIYRRNYIDVMKRKNEPSHKSEFAERDLEIKRALMQSIRRYGQSDRLAMQNLLTHLGQVALEAHQELNAAGESEDKAALEQHAFRTSAEQTDYFNRNRRKSARSSVGVAYDADIDAELAAFEPLVQAHVNEMLQYREPQAQGDVVPSASAKGNLTGNTFKPGRWALTYDDGPHATHTSSILTNLTNTGHKASFFWLASLTPKFPTLIGRTKELGHAMGNHSFSHANLPKQGQAALNREIITSTETHTRMFGFKPTYFRCPYGACGGNGSNIRQMIANQGMVHIFWNVDSLDWQDKNPASIVRRVKQAMAVAKKGILLFHDIHPQTVEATRQLMTEWAPQVRSGTMRLLTIPQAINELNSDAGMQ